MKLIPRDCDKYYSHSVEEKASAAVALATGCSIGAYYKNDGNGKFLKASDTIGIYEQPGVSDPFPETQLPYKTTDPNQFPIYAPNGYGGKNIIGFVAVARGANILEPHPPSEAKRRIGEFIADTVAPHLASGNFTATHTNTMQLAEQFRHLSEINEKILGEHAKPESIHPEILHAESVAELMRITFEKAQTPSKMAKIYANGYKIHDMAKICTLPPDMLMPEVNQATDIEISKKCYFGERNLHHPFDFVILFPFADKEIVSNIALHHLAVSSDTKNKMGLPAYGVPEIAKYGRVADVFAALTDHARYPGLPVVSAEEALKKIFDRAKISSEDIPLDQLGRMVAAGVFDKYVESRQSRSSLGGGIKTDEDKVRAIEAEILSYFKAQKKDAVTLSHELQASLKMGRIL